MSRPAWTGSSPPSKRSRQRRAPAMTRADNSPFLAQANARRHQAALAAAHHAIEQLQREGQAVNLQPRSRNQPASPGAWLYRQDQIRDLINRLAHARNQPAAAHRATRNRRLAPPAARHRPRRDHPPASREPHPPRPARPPSRPPAEPAAEHTARRATMTPAPTPPTTAALTCPRRRNTYLPGTIHKRLQITAVRRSSSGLHDALAECSRSDIMGGCCATYCCATPFGTSVLSPRQDVVR